MRGGQRIAERRKHRDAWTVPSADNVLSTGDLPELAAALAPRPLRLEGLVDGLNRKVAPDVLGRRYEPAQAAHAQTKAADRFRVGDREAEEPSLAGRLKTHLSHK